jgi:hypothetical protein
MPDRLMQFLVALLLFLAALLIISGLALAGWNFGAAV